MLRRKPRDCTEPTKRVPNMNSPDNHAASNTMVKFTKLKTKVKAKPPAKQKPKKTTKQRSPVVVPKPQTSFGEDLGSLVGKGVTQLSKWMGFGAYTVNQNTIIGAGGSVPAMHSTRDSIIVRHREYIGDVLSSTSFASTSISLNPGLASSYPWLAKIASSFQQYKIHGMVIQYIPEVSEVAAAEVSLGFVCLAAEYRTDLPSFPSLNQALESQFAVSIKPNCPVDLAIECDPRQSPYNTWYVRTNSVPSGEDIKTFDFVNVNVLVGNNQTGGVVLGQLWNTYEIELFRPTSFLDPPNTQFYAHIYSTVPTSAAPLASYTMSNYVNPIGTNTIGSSTVQKAIADGFASASPSTGQIQITMPRGLTGAFLVTFSCVGSNTASIIWDNTYTVVNASKISTMFNSTGAIEGAPSVAQTAAIVTGSWAFVISNAQASAGQAVITVGSSSLVLPVSGAAQSDLIITQLATSAS